MVSSFDLQLLAESIKYHIQQDFAEVHLSRNLMDTIKVNRTDLGYEIEIPAEIYDLNRWYKEGIVVYTNEGSYAQAVDDSGGFSGVHKNYVLNAIMDAIEEWQREMRNKYDFGKVGVL